MNPNTGEVVPIRFYYNTGEDPSLIENIIGEMTSFYSEEFGDHPFEKNGFASLNDLFSLGGMENQTLTSFCPECWEEYLAAHEYAHQWFGDMITCATWADIFLNEGFATWVEANWTEHAYGYDAYKNEMYWNALTYRFINSGWAISEPDWAINTPSVDVLFDFGITYMKASCVLHQLRYVLGDSLFFAGMKAYATDTVNFRYKTATIPEFRDKMESVAGQDLDWFFDEWIYHPDHPIYNNEYTIRPLEGDSWNLTFTAKQEQGSVFYWQMPMDIKVTFADLSDTTLSFFNNYNNQVFTFEFTKQPLSLEFDPNNDILLKDGYTIVGNSEILSNTTGLKIVPSITDTEVRLSYNLRQTSDVKIEVFDSSGSLVLMQIRGIQSPGDRSSAISVSELPKGVYLLRLTTSFGTETARFIRR